jgi:enoyl-CoA hydratase/carnithine racemase
METVLVDRDGGVVTVTLNRPDRLNALTATMAAELLAVVRDVGGRPDDRVLVLTGAGRAFCAGADLSEDSLVAAQGGLRGMRALGDVVLALHRLPQPTIAKVGGVAVGAGLNLALGCDLIVASEDARMSQIFSKRGLTVDGGGSWLLPRLVGLHRAKELVFLSDMLSAADAADLGLVNRVVPAAELDAVVAEWAARLAAGPPVALSMSKALLNAGAARSMAEAVEAEAQAQSLNFTTADVAEAMQAFVEKREPRFEGR